ncbi:MAG: response regulator transcription factor [Candidatus Baltobacteraceae bacterium]
MPEVVIRDSEDSAPARPFVIVADDDPVVRRLLEVTVRNAGCDVATAKNGDEALELMAGKQPVLAILDVSMPFRSGLEVARELRARGQSVPIIFLTSHTQEQDVLEGFLSGAVDYVFKPFSPRELQARIKAMLLRS